MTEQIHAPTDAQTTNQPLRFETVVTWDRPLTHELDKPERLNERLSKIPVDGEVSVAEFTDTGARVIVETTPDEMGHSVSVIPSKVLRVIRNYNSRVIDGDDLTDPPRPRGVSRKHVRCAYEGKERRELRSHISPEAWERAKEIAEGLNLEGAPALVPEIHIRTVEGELGA